MSGSHVTKLGTPVNRPYSVTNAGNDMNSVPDDKILYVEKMIISAAAGAGFLVLTDVFDQMVDGVTTTRAIGTFPYPNTVGIVYDLEDTPIKVNTLLRGQSTNNITVTIIGREI